ncbi:uncharacterized protein LOC143035239 isoform X2 [Oratosquilla oratoria]|uniref:uncharacterized protein LOC143035239 isoform X2 n=1 Tax=Oratosquilla oratoria TaxID=337810 RepID=UPI003F75BE56
MPRECKNHPDKFCYVCGNFTTKQQRRNITTNIKKIYKLYFDCHLGDQDKPWAPHQICSACSNGLRDWVNKKKASMPFAIPMIWREPRDHHGDCYFCSVNLTGFSRKNKHKIVYPTMDSARRPVPHCEELPIPIPPDDRANSIEDDVYDDEGVTGGIPGSSADPDYTLEGTTVPDESCNVLGDHTYGASTQSETVAESVDVEVQTDQCRTLKRASKTHEQVHEDQIADVDMDDPLKIAAPTLKEEIEIKEEPLDESEMFIGPGGFCIPTEKVGVKRERDSNNETETATEDEDMALWTIEHRVFAYDSYVKNNESVAAVQCEFRRHFNIHQNEAVPTHNTILCWVNALRTRGTLMCVLLPGGCVSQT